MAFTKTVTLLSGVDAGFWKVCTVIFDFRAKVATIVYCGFKNETMFNSFPYEYLTEREISVRGDDFDTYFVTGGDIAAQAETALLALVSDLLDGIPV